MQLLVVDDSPDLLDLVKRSFEREGHEVRVAPTLERARSQVRAKVPDVLVLDVELPDGSGVELCRELRSAHAYFPILLLTAHGEVHERVAGLDAGADDFLAKPFAVAELRARVRALARRGPLERPAVVRVGTVELDMTARRALQGERELPVTAREWAVLDLLVSRAGRVVSRSTILESVWGEESEGASASLDVIMARLRRKLGSDALRTVRGEGYVVDVG